MYSTKQAWFNEEGSAWTVLNHGLFGWYFPKVEHGHIFHGLMVSSVTKSLGQKLDFADQKSAHLCVLVQIESSLFNTLKTLAYFSTSVGSFPMMFYPYPDVA